MGRRLSLLAGILWVLTSAATFAQEPKPAEKAGAEAGAPALPAIAASDDSTPAPAAGAKARPAGAAGAGEDAPPPNLPASLPEPEEPGPASPLDAQPVRPDGPGARDPEVLKAQAPTDPKAAAPAQTPPVAPAPAPATAPAAAGGDLSADGPSFVIPAERLPLGKQEVNLSVDVQAPGNMVFNRDATVKIVVRNSGSTDALGVMVRDELPDGLAYVSSQPEAQRVGGSLLSWRISTLPAGSERVILLRVKPSKVGGALEHAATATFQAGSKATSRVLRPRLKLEVVQAPTDGKVLKNKTAEYRIAVTNTGDGPARNVIVQAKLSPGLRHETGERNEDNSYELPIQELGPGQREDLDPLTVDAVQGGEQWCMATATSPDVDLDKEAAEVKRTIEVVEPKLQLALTGPDKRYTDTVAPYTIALENPGTAPARNVRVLATLGVSGRLVAVPPGAKYDTTSRRLQWTINQIDPRAKAISLPFEVRMGGISAYEINVEVRGDNGLNAKDRRITDVQGMADVDLVVREKRRVVDVDGTTTFQVRLRNYGTKEATRLQVKAVLSENLQVVETAGGPDEKAVAKGNEVIWPIIERLGPAKECLLGVKVQVTKPQPKIGTCRVYLVHDDLSDPLEDMAGVKVTESRRVITGP